MIEITSMFGKGNIGEEGCPCGWVVCEGYKIESYCWKSGTCDEHEFSCVHVYYNDGYEKLAAQHGEYIRKYIEDAYRTECGLKMVRDIYD